jgi:DNA-binding LacI/PurR family transcriptional regulator
MSKVTPQRQPKYSQVAADLRAAISSGRLRVGDRLPSYSEMRTRGISQPTLDRVHSILESEGLIEKKHGSGVFVAHPAARSVERHGVIGIAGLEANDSAHPYWAHLLKGVRRAARAAGLDVLLLGDQLEASWERIDGLVVGGYTGYDLAASRPEMLPAIGLMMNGVSGLSCVTGDDASGVELAMHHLLELNHHRIAYLADVPSERLTGYRRALSTVKIEPPAAWMREFAPHGKVNGWKFFDYGRAAMAQWLREDWSTLGCTALLCHNDEIAIGALRALKDAGLRVPEDISVVGFDGTELASHADPPLTTVATPLEEIGARGVELLLQWMADDEQDNGVDEVTVESTLALPASLHIGESTARARFP